VATILEGRLSRVEQEGRLERPTRVDWLAMQACNYATVFVVSAFALATQFAGCATKGSPTPETASSESSLSDPAGSGATDMAEPEGAETATDTGVSTPESGGGGDADPASPPTGDSAPAGGSDRDLTQIQKLVSDNRKPVRACYDKARKELPDLKGTMTITFIIDPEGNVKSAELNPERSEVKSPDIVNCAISVIKSLKFAKSAKGMETTVNYPYTFKPQGGG
jgi:hypothetical protein